MSNGRRVAGVVALTVMVSAAGLLVGVPINAVTGQDRWPGILDVLRRYPWESAGVCFAVAVAGGVALWWLQERPGAGAADPPPLPPPAVAGGGQWGSGGAAVGWRVSRLGRCGEECWGRWRPGRSAGAVRLGPR